MISEENFLVLVGDEGSPAPGREAPPELRDAFAAADTVIAVKSDYSSAYVMKYRYDGEPGGCLVKVCDLRTEDERAQGVTGPWSRGRIGELETRLAEALSARDRARAEVRDLRGALEVAQHEVERHVADGVSGPRFRALAVENAELRHHARRLVELLHDAWWVEAAQHLHDLRAMTDTAGTALS